MPSGRDVGAGRRGGSTTKKNAFCSFCRKSYRDVGPLVEGPGDVYICGECIELCHSIITEDESRQLKRRRSSFTSPDEIPRPREIYEGLNRYVIGQDAAQILFAKKLKPAESFPLVRPKRSAKFG